MRHILLLPILIILSACSTGMPMQPYAQPNASPYKFNLCHGYGCTLKSPVTLTDQQWQYVTEPLIGLIQNGGDERRQIAVAIRRMEKIATKSARINPDKAEASPIRTDMNQMDCIDETINTNLTLRLLEEAGLFKFHSTSNVVHRGYFIDGKWPHNSATIRELDSNTIYVIDSYYSSSGGEIRIKSLAGWMSE